MNFTEWRDALLAATFPSRLALHEGAVERKVSGADVRHVLLALGTYANRGDGKNAHPGVQNLVALTGRSMNTVRRCLRVGVDIGWIRQVGSAGPGRAAAYDLAVPVGAGEQRPADGGDLVVLAANEEATEGRPLIGGGVELGTSPQSVPTAPPETEHRPTTRGAHMSDPTCPIPPIDETARFVKPSDIWGVWEQAAFERYVEQHPHDHL